MDDPRDAEDATRELDGSRMCGRRVKVQMSKPVRNHGGDGGRDRGYDRPYPGDRGRGRSRSRTPERRRRRSPSYRSMSREKSRSRSRRILEKEGKLSQLTWEEEEEIFLTNILDL